MENKKTKLTLSGIAKKSIENIELAKTQGKNSVVIEKKVSKFNNKRNLFNKSKDRSFTKSKPINTFNISSQKTKTNDFEKRKLAEQRARKSKRFKSIMGSK